MLFVACGGWGLATYVYRVFCGTLLDQSDSLVIPNTCSLTSPIRFAGSAVEIGEQRRQSTQEKTQSLAVATCSVAVQKPATSTPAVYCHDVTVCTVEARNSSLPRHNNSWPYQRVSTSFMYLKGHCNLFTLSSFLRTSAPNDLATPICGCFHPSFGLLGPWYTWYELVWGMALV